jgi:CHAT domain-containing protein
MRSLPRLLGLALTFWLAISRPSTPSRAEIATSEAWWNGTRFADIREEAARLRGKGDFAGLESVYLRAIEDARTLNNAAAETSYLTALGNTYVYLSRYDDALVSYGRARDVARAHRDWLAEGAVAPGISSIYLLTGDWPAAKEAIDAGLAAARRIGRHPYYEPQLRLQQARLRVGEPSAFGDLQDAVAIAQQQNDPLLESEALDLLGEAYLATQNYISAEKAFEGAYALRRERVAHELRLSYWRLGQLRLAQGRLDEAETLTAQALAESSRPGTTLGIGTLLHLRGRIRRAQNRPFEALRDFAAAAESAERWRQAVPPQAQRTLVAADAQINNEILDTFVEAAADWSLTEGDKTWAERAFVTLERSRAASLRHTAALAPAWRRKLPSQYWKLLAQLRDAESTAVLDDTRPASAERLHAALAEMEVAVGLGSSRKYSESFPQEFTLGSFRQTLGMGDLFLSFHVGKQASYLWAVTPKSLHLYRLEPNATLETAVRQFREAVEQRRAEAEVRGMDLERRLFGSLQPEESGLQNWWLSVDGPLFDLPFAALGNRTSYLAERHALQQIPSAAMLGTMPATGSGLLALGDPVYNWADPRAPLTAESNAQRVPGQLNRLPASGAEVRSLAAAWSTTRPIEGIGATRDRFVSELERTSWKAVHLATHVVADSAQRGYLAFSLGANGSPELMGAAEIAMLQVPGTVVVMTGCASGSGEIRTGAGQLGLERAWLVAGARSVVATNWPVEDTSGGLLPTFYRSLLQGTSVSEALRRGQIEMIHSRSWQADPAYWAAFQVTGGVR